jgi:hypothetical protein
VVAAKPTPAASPTSQNPPTAVVAAKPTPAAAPTLKIKGVLKNQPMAEVASPAQSVAAEATEEYITETNPFTQAELDAAWRKYAALLDNSKTRLQQAMQQNSPTLAEAYGVTFEANNTLYLDELEEAKKRIVHFLQKELRNNSISLSFTVSAADSQSKRTLLYTDSDKYAHLSEKNPSLQTLKNALSLDF